MHSPAALRAIALFKFAKALLLVCAGVAAIQLQHSYPPLAALALVERLHLDAYPRVANALIGKVLQLDPEKLKAAGVGAFAYGVLFFVEGFGLWRGRHWAEYLTIVSTAGFLPIEAIEIAHRPDVERLLVMAANVVILVYLVWRLRAERHRPALRPAHA